MERNIRHGHELVAAYCHFGIGISKEIHDRCMVAQYQVLPILTSMLMGLFAGHVIGVWLMNNDAAKGGLLSVFPLKEGGDMGITSFRKVDFLQEGFDHDVLVEHYLYLTVIRDGLKETED